MSNAKELATFLVGIAPELIKLGEQLFEAHDGDIGKAQYDIADRRAEIASKRSSRDAQLANKHRDDGDGGQ